MSRIGFVGEERNCGIVHGRDRVRRLRLKTFVFLLLLALLGPSSDVAFRAGMKHVGALSHYSPLALAVYGEHAFTNPFVLLGLLGRILFIVVLMLVLSWADYSFVTPASAINYVITAYMGHAILGEAVSPTRWAGIALICLGVAFVGITPTSTTSRRVGPKADS